MTSDPDSLRIGEWQFLPRQHSLRRGAELRRLPRRLALLLQALAAAPGETLDRASLIAAAWTRRGVDEEALSRAIASLRQALDDDAREPRYIATVPKLGYRLIAPVQAEPVVGAAERERADVEAAPISATPPRRPRWLRPVPVLALGGLLGAVALGAWWRQLSPSSPDAAWSAARLAREHPFLSGPGRESDPRFSSDGRWLAFVRSEPGRARGRIWVAQRDGGNARALTPEAGVYASPAFVPGTSDLVYERREDGRCDVLRQPLFAAEPRRLAACAASAEASGLDVREDGSLVFVADAVAGTHGAIALLAPEARQARALTAPEPADAPDALPRFAPDGRHIAFVRGSAGERRLLELALDDLAAPRVLIADRNRIDGLAYTPDGTQLLLATDRHDYRALVALDRRSGAVQRLGGRGAAGVDAARDGALLYVQQLYIANLWTMSLPAQRDGLRPLTQATRYVSQPALSPDDRQVAYVSTGEGRETVWLRDLAGGEERRLPLDPALRWVRPAFAPDGASLFLTGYGDDGAHAWRHELRSGRTTRVDDIDGAAVVVRENAAGERIAARPQGAHFALWRGRAAQAAPVAGAEDIDEFQLDGDVLAFLPAGGTLRLLDLRSGASHAVAAVGAANRYAWHLRDGQVYAAVEHPDGAHLLRLGLDGERQADLGPASPTTAGPSLQVAAGARFAVFGRVDRIDTDLILAPAPP